jgi:hypothetical protein
MNQTSKPEKTNPDTVQIDIVQIDTAQIDTAQIDTAQIDTAQIDTAQIDTAQIDTAQIDAVQIDAVQIDAVQIDAVRIFYRAHHRASCGLELLRAPQNDQPFPPWTNCHPRRGGKRFPDRRALERDTPGPPQQVEQTLVTNWPVGIMSPAGIEIRPRRGWITFVELEEVSPPEVFPPAAFAPPGFFVNASGLRARESRTVHIVEKTLDLVSRSRDERATE